MTFYVHVHAYVYVSNLRKLADVEWCFVIGQCHGNRAVFDVGVDGAFSETSLRKVPIDDVVPRTRLSVRLNLLEKTLQDFRENHQPFCKKTVAKQSKNLACSDEVV